MKLASPASGPTGPSTRLVSPGVRPAGPVTRLGSPASRPEETLASFVSPLAGDSGPAIGPREDAGRNARGRTASSLETSRYHYPMRRQRNCVTSRLSLLSTAALLALAAGSPAWGCSVAASASPPTNYELVREAPVIVLAKSAGWEPSAGAVRFEVEEVLKGDFRPATVTLEGQLDFAGRGSEDDFSQARPGAYAGSCLAYDYRLNHHYVLFLEWEELNGKWSVHGPAFSRVNEEVDVPASPWLTAVRQYLQVAALHDYDKEKLALRELREKAASEEGAKTLPKALAKDIDRHFQAPSLAKSPADLIGLYEHAGSDTVRREALWAIALNAPPAARDLLRAQILKETLPDRLTPLGIYFAAVPDHEILGPLAQNWDRLSSDSWTRTELLRALVKAAGPSDAPILAGLLRKASDDEQATLLAQWFASPGNDPRIAIDIMHGRLEDTPGDFTRYQDSLAVLGDPAVVAWAAERIWLDPKLEIGQTAARVLAFSPLPAADAAARKVIETGGPQRTQWLVMAFTDPLVANTNPRRWDRLEDILRTQSTNKPLLETLKTDFFYLRRKGTDEDKAAANRLFERTRDTLAALRRPSVS